MNTRIEARKRWRWILGRYRGSGLSVVAFCRQAGIAQSSFFAWQRKLRDEVATSPRKSRDSISRDSFAETATFPRASEGVIAHEAQEKATLPHSSQDRNGFAEVKVSPIGRQPSQDSSNAKANGVNHAGRLTTSGNRHTRSLNRSANPSDRYTEPGDAYVQPHSSRTELNDIRTAQPSNSSAEPRIYSQPHDSHTQPTGIELRLPGYGVIMVRRGFDRQTLIELLDVLEARSSDRCPAGAIDGLASSYDIARTAPRRANA